MPKHEISCELVENKFLIRQLIQNRWVCPLLTPLYRCTHPCIIILVFAKYNGSFFVMYCNNKNMIKLYQNIYDIFWIGPKLQKKQKLCLLFKSCGVLLSSCFLAGPKRSKLQFNDLYIYLRLFAKYGAKRPSQKKVINLYLF
jgi:hypothetical protein